MNEITSNYYGSTKVSTHCTSGCVGVAAFAIARWSLPCLNQYLQWSTLANRPSVTVWSSLAGITACLATHLYLRKRPSSLPDNPISGRSAVPQQLPPIGYAPQRTFDNLLPNHAVHPSVVDLFGRHFAQEENRHCGKEWCQHVGVGLGQMLQEGDWKFLLSKTFAHEIHFSSYHRFSILFWVEPDPGTSHVVIATIDVENKEICVHDPIHRRYEAINHNLQHWLFSRFKQEGQTVNPDEWQFRVNPGTPRQTNGWDCAIFEVMILQRFFKGEPIILEDFTPEKVTQYRAEMRQRLLPSPISEEMTIQEFPKKQEYERNGWRKLLILDPADTAIQLRSMADAERHFLLEGMPESDPLYPHLSKEMDRCTRNESQMH